MQAEPGGYTIGAISDGPMIVNPALYSNASVSFRCATSYGVAMINRHPPDADRASIGTGDQTWPI